ncbi:hypothetical protein K437DRAFT_243984 [Tilletiaria anomala UBC 951]|uniref:E3 ubiquitin-protein ligase n=1 Tax=Tilletiaria anomala (strain ATCC 24038 / CBS 436.72 / UBC 951) TaxID=1037660 RepID=A0A066WML8_TILAU|nr:uncharacterized protein K437DRAFT_243984 [Tilletiaria anomala UBC 951]KDN52254.1 hypothetical protein K437DRAFT_243984 [Tilletiaria anomala UBC 951]
MAQDAGLVDPTRSPQGSSRSTPSDFIKAHLGQSHPFFSQDGGGSWDVAGSPFFYLVDQGVTSRLLRSLWTSLLASLPSPSHLLPTRATQLPTIEATLEFLQEHDWKLSEAQKAAQKQADEANAKGKAVERGNVNVSSQGLGASSKAFSLGPEYGPDRKGMPCGHIFREGEAIYRCRDCGHDDTCVQCAPCFNVSNHQGHDIVFSISSDSTGCCDCGDDEAWNKPLGCKYHQSDVYVPSSSTLSSSDITTGARGFSPSFQETKMELDDVSSQAANVPSSTKGKGREMQSDAAAATSASGSASSGAIPTPPEAAEMAALLQTIPKGIRTALEAHVSSIFDFILDTFEHAPDQVSISSTPDAVSRLQASPSLAPVGPPSSSTAHTDTDRDGHGESATSVSDVEAGRDRPEETIAYTSDSAEFMPALPGGFFTLNSWMQRGSRGSLAAPSTESGGRSLFSSDLSEAATPRPGGPKRSSGTAAVTATKGGPSRYFTLLLWNDEKHDFTQVIDIVMDVTGRNVAQAKAVAERVDKHGRDIIEISTDVPKLLLWGLKLNSIDLAVSIRPSFDIFAEEIAAVLIKHLLDLTSSVLYVPKKDTGQGGKSNQQEEGSQPHLLETLVPSAALMRALVTDQLLKPWDHNKPVYADSMSSAFFSASDLRKLDGLLLLESKLRKELRGDVKQVLMACIGIKETKKEVALRFAHMYSKVLETFILRDREADHSICFMTVQLFSVPSIASTLVAQHGFLEKLLLILQAIFTSQQGNEPLQLPPSPPPKGQANPNSPLFKQQRCYHIFYDVRYLLSAEGVQQQLVSQLSHLNYFLDFLSLFNAITPDRRAVSQHVEYESDVWIPVFHVSSHLGRAAKLFGESFAKSNTRQLAAALGLTARRILLNCLTLHQNDPEVHAPVIFHTVPFGGRSFQIIDFAVDTQATSFHHPMHWLFAEMLKHVNVLSGENIAALGKSSLADLLVSDVDENGVLVLLEFPLRVAVKLAQVRSGMWVRNGYALRSQAHHYRENPMRDIMYDQDLYLLQCGLLLADPDRWLVTIIDRFGLTWFFEDGSADADHVILMADEFMLLLVYLLTETAILGGWSMEKLIRREIVHFLALGSGTYSEITKHVSERFMDHPSFEKVLGQVSNFRAPDGITDLGIFELKKECFDQVRPCFMHYSRNQREKAEEILMERHKKNGGREETAFAWTAAKADIENSGLLASGRLHDVFLTTSFMRVACSTLLNCQHTMQHTPESLLDSTLHLLSAALSEKGYAVAAKMLAPPPARSGPSTNLEGKNLPLLGLLCSLEADERFKPTKHKVTWLINQTSELVRASQNAEAMELVNQIFTKAGKAPVGIDAQSSEKKRSDAKRAAAKARQAAIMQKFSAQQKDLLKSLEDDLDADDMDEDAEHSTASGTEAERKSFGSCILCQEDLDGTKPFGVLAHIQTSRVIRMMPCADSDAIAQAANTPLTLDRGEGKEGRRLRGLPGSYASTAAADASRPAGSFPPAYNKPGMHTTTCGHLMHAACFWDYCRSVEQRHALQIAREHPEDLSRCEYVCPLCKALGNVILPLPESHSCDAIAAISKGPPDSIPLADWIRKINIDILKWSTSQSQDYQEADAGTGTFLPWYAEDSLTSLSGNTHFLGQVDLDTYHMLDRFLTVLRLQSSELKPLRVKMQQRTILALPSRKLYMPQELIGYTLSMIEIGQRGLVTAGQNTPGANIANGASDSTLSLLRSLIHCLRLTAIIDLNEHHGLEVIRQGLLKRLLPHWAGDDAVRSPLILRDPMSILIEAAAIAPEALDHIITLMYYVFLVQLVFGLAQPSMWPQGPMGFGGSRYFAITQSSPSYASDIAAAREVFPDVRWTTANIIGLVGYARGNITLGVDHLEDDTLAKLLCTHSLPFLRRAAVLRAAVFGTTSAVNAGAAGPDRHDSEYLRLMRHMNVPLPSVALPARAERQTPLAGLIEGWIKHAYVPLASLFRPLPIHYSSLNSMASFGASQISQPPAHPTLLLEHPHIYELVNLPDDLATLLQETQQRVCKRCKQVPTDPALCLLCGEIVCYQSFCCQSEDGKRGECNRHMDECSGAVGIYFKVKTNVVLLLYEQNGTFLFSPYLDSHGEVDIGLRKGRPQRLHRQRYDELRKQWLQHGISNLVARKIEQTLDTGGWTTF